MNVNAKFPNYPLLIPALVGLLCPLVATAADDKVLFETSFEQPEEFSDLGIKENMVVAEGHTGDAALSLTQRRLTLPTAFLPINPDLSYRLQAAFKAAPGSEGTPIILVLQYCDQNGEPIPNFGVRPVPGTQTVLKTAAAAKAENILLEDVGQDWPEKGIFAVAFGANDDLSDIPNSNVFQIASVTKEEGGLRVKLADPLTKDFPAGTPMRWHQLVDPPMAHITPSGQWETHGLTVEGSALPGDSLKKMRSSFWPGTASVRVRLGFRDRASEEQGKEIWVDDVSLSQVSE